VAREAPGPTWVRASSVRRSRRVQLTAPRPWLVGAVRPRWLARHLMVVAITLPIAFVLVVEALRFAVAGSASEAVPPWQGYHLLVILIMVAGIVGFSVTMFHLIDRAQAALQWQNRELAATNAVSAAVQGEQSLDRILDAALGILLDSTGAAYASLTVFTGEGSGSGDTARHTRFRVSRTAVEESRVEEEPSIVVPLARGAASLGQLCLWRVRDTIEPLGLARETLDAIASQLAGAIQLAQLVGDLNRRKTEGHAFYDILLQISHQTAPADVLTAVVRHALNRVGADAVALTLSDEAARAVQYAADEGEAVGRPGAPTPRDRFELGTEHAPEDGGWPAEAVVPVSGASDELGRLWVARRDDEPFAGREVGFLTTLASVAAIAITSAQLREAGRQRAVLDERERIAREMHDSLAQVLGSTHLRLRLIESTATVAGDPAVHAEISDLADTCHEAYLDVRESILGLRDSAKRHGLEETLQTFLTKYARTSGVRATLDNRLDRRLTLSPPCEVHIIRVIQEALTNVRKHAGAREVVVRITEDDSGTVFQVEDDGDGFDPAGQDGDGFGLYTMRDRMAILRGSLAVDSAPGRGTRVVATVPERSKPCSVDLR